MSDGLTRDFPKYTYVNRPVSKYVFEMLDLQVGQQTRLIAAKKTCGWVYEDKVMCTAHAWKQRHAFGFVKNFRFCYDSADKTVYCLAQQDGISDCYCAYITRVGEYNVTFFKVNSIVVRKNSIREYLDMDIRIRICFLFF